MSDGPQSGTRQPVRVSTDSKYEELIGYSRAVRIGERVLVSGNAPVMPDGAEPPRDGYGQTIRCLQRVEEALAQAGASVRHVVRTRIYMTHVADFDDVARAHGEFFRDVRPANTIVIVSALVDPQWRVEVEAEAEIF